MDIPTFVLPKLLTSLLNNRLLNYAITNRIISPNQLGFLPGNRISDAHIIINNLILRKCHINNSRIYSCFIDFSKARDTIPRDKLLNKLLKYDIKGNVFNTIKNIYFNDKAFEINQGVKQGSILGPSLYNIFMSDRPDILDSNLNEINPKPRPPELSSLGG